MCRSGGKLYALPLTAVVEVMRPLPIQPVPNASPIVLGVALIRGIPMAVLDMPGLLGGTWNADGRFVTVRAGSRQVALAVDQVLEVRTLPPETFCELPPLLRDIGNEAVGALGTLDAELLFVLKDACLIPELPAFDQVASTS